MLAVQHQNGMNMGLLINYGYNFCSPVNAVPPVLPEMAHIGPQAITQQDTLLMQVLDLDCEFLLRA